MAIAATGGLQSAATSVTQQLQTQLAQRNAEQAEATARALRRQASAAQQDADRAQENARSLRVQSAQADSRAGSARQAAVSVDALAQVDAGLQSIREGIASGLSAMREATPVPAVNAEGQTTGTLINVTA